MLLKFKLQASRELIFSFLTDMQKIVSAHPVILKLMKQVKTLTWCMRH